ncbi:translation initiation factor IF-2 [Trifolium repens]|nr:translation initiation factor IF-2 [Trifolium repens]
MLNFESLILSFSLSLTPWFYHLHIEHDTVLIRYRDTNFALALTPILLRSRLRSQSPSDPLLRIPVVVRFLSLSRLLFFFEFRCCARFFSNFCLQELKANPDRSAKGTVIEAGLDKSKGPFATFIVQNGTLKRGDIVVCGGSFGKVRALFDDGGKRVDEATPSIPVQVIGLNNVPVAGDVFEQRQEMGDGKVTLSSLASAVSSGKLSGLDLHQLNVILKVDLQGSIEAVKQALQVLPQDNVPLKFFCGNNKHK